MTPRLIDKAYQTYLNRDFLAAETTVSNLLQKSPDDNNGLRLGALIALSNRDFCLARERAERAITLFGESADLLHTYANILDASDCWLEAETAYRRSLAIDSTQERPRQELVALLLKSGQPVAALSAIGEATTNVCRSKTLTSFKIDALIKSGEVDAAFDVLFQCDGVLGSEDTAHFHARLLDAKGSQSAFINKVEHMSQTYGLRPQTHTLYCNSLAGSGKEKEAEALLESTCRDPRTGLDTQVCALNVLSRVATPDIFQTHLEDAYARYGRAHELLAVEAAAALKSGSAARALELLKTALTSAPRDTNLLSAAAQAAISVSDLEFAESLITSGRRQTPHNQLFIALQTTLGRAKGDAEASLIKYDDFVKEYVITPPEGYQSIEDFNDALKQVLMRYHVTSNAPLDQSFKGGSQTQRDLLYENDPILRAFFAAVDGPINDFMAGLDRDEGHPFLSRNTGKHRINGAWSILLSASGYHHNHIHPMGWMSSAYYVDVPKTVAGSNSKEGWLKFGEPGVSGVTLPAQKYVEPANGKLVLFPSYMWHGTVPFTGPTRRLTLPFDIVPA